MRALARIIMIASTVLLCISCTPIKEPSPSPYKNIYEIFVYSFYDTDGDGIGDINGVTEKLDYVADDLGMNGIWLMPIMPSTTYHKYDVTDYYAIDSEYGSLEDFVRLTEAAEKKGVDIIIDFVFNHTSAQHPWFLEATEYLMALKPGEKPDASLCPYIDYYHFSQLKEGNPSYYQVGASTWYYEGVFWDQMPDLNLDNPNVRREFEKIADFWIECGVDGFRLDAAKEYHSGASNKNIEVLRWFQEYIRSVNEEIYIVAEVWDTAPTIGTYYQSGIESIFNFPVAQYNGTIVSAVRGIGNMTPKRMVETLVGQQGLYQENSETYTDALFLSNHDTTRLAAQCMYDVELMKFAAGISMTLPGNLFVYYGEEIGMSSLGDKDENKRLGMRWSDDNSEGLCTGPDQADVVEHRFYALDRQMEDQMSLYQYYKQGIALRKKYPALAAGDFVIVESMTNDKVATLMRSIKPAGEKQIYVLYNMSSEEVTVTLDKLQSNIRLVDELSVTKEHIEHKDTLLKIPRRTIAILEE